MTIIYGYNLNNHVALAADRRRVSFNHQGQITGIETEGARKVLHLSRNAIIVSAGAGIGEPMKGLIQSILRGRQDEVPPEDVIRCTREVLQTNWRIMDKYEPRASRILPLRVWIGGFYQGKAFLSSLVNTNNFEEVAHHEEGVHIWGPIPEYQSRARQELERYAPPPNDPVGIINMFSGVNRVVAKQTRLINAAMNAIVVRRQGGLLSVVVSKTGELRQETL